LDIVLYQTKDNDISINACLDGETVWLNRNQIAQLFDRDIKTIGKHINNTLSEELKGLPTVAEFVTVQMKGEREVERLVEHYNLDVIISVGYRVKSRQGAEFRRWSNNVFKNYILKGYALNNNRIDQLGSNTHYEAPKRD
jgi:hypothetical protein